jgi:tetratricopeptide (TPR) repeat protein
MDKKLKDEIQSDALVTRYAQLLHWAHHNTKTLQWIAAGSVVLILGAFGYGWHAGKQAAEAQVLLAGPERAMMMGDFNTALYGDGSTITGLMELAKKHRRSDAGNIATYYAAVAAANLGEYESALGYISSFKAPKGIMGVGAVALHAGILESLERHSEAGRWYERAADWDVNDNTTPKFLTSAAYAYLNAGEPRKAAELAERILTSYGSSPAANTAKQIQARATL